MSSLPDDARLAGVETGRILAVKKTSKAPPPKGEVDLLSVEGGLTGET